MTSVAPLLTPEMATALQRDCDRLRAERRINRLENIAVRSAEITEAWQESGQDFVTVHFLASLLDYTTDESGVQVLEGSRTEPVKFEEYWTFTRPVGPGPFRLSAIFLAAVSVALLAAGTPQLGDQSFDLSALVWLAFLYAVVGPLVITNLLWFSAIDRVGPSRASLFANLQPFLAAVIALLLLHESLTRLQVAGGLLIAAGIVFSRGRTPPPEPA